MEPMSLQEAIKQSYLTQGLAETDLALLYEIATLQHYPAGTAILKQFERERDLLILASGRAHIVTVLEEPIGIVKQGMPIGEVSFLDGRPRSVSVVAEVDCSAVVLPAERLMKILNDNPGVANAILWNVSRVLCMRLRAANNNIAALLAIDESSAAPVGG